MLGPGRYLLGVVELLLVVGFAWLGASAVRARLLPSFRGAPSALATLVLTLTLLIWTAELLGTVSQFQPAPFVLAVIFIGLALRLGVSGVGGAVGGPMSEEALATAGHGGSPAATGPAPETPRPSPSALGIAALIAGIALIHFALDAKSKLTTGMTGFDTTWYHAPFAAGFNQTGNTIDLHFIAPQFLAWFYPANGEILHATGMLAFGRDLLSPLLNIGWFAGCLLACWCIGRPYRVAAWSLALGAIALSVPALSDQAGEARNDIVGVFFLLSAVAVALNMRRGWSTGALVVVGLAAGLAAGTKLNFLLPAAVLVVGLAVVSPAGRRRRSLGVGAVAALLGGGYWYLRNLVHTGNPLPWVRHLGPIDLPAPEQALGGREAHSVASYLFDGSVWSDWFLPGLHGGLWIVWPLVVGAAFIGLLLPVVAVAQKFGRAEQRRHARSERGDTLLALVALVGLASALAWLVAPTSASGPEGMPRGFESGLRYLAPALVLGLALLPAAPQLRDRLAALTLRSRRSSFFAQRAKKDERTVAGVRRKWAFGALGGLVALAVAVGYPVQRHYLRDRYADPTFSTPGLNAAFAWARDLSGARIATTSTRQYPFFGTDLSNRVEFIGEEKPHGGFEAPTTCRAYRRLLAAGDYEYVVASRDRTEPGKPPYPSEAGWTEGPWARVVLEKPPTVVFRLTGPPDPSSCPD